MPAVFPTTAVAVTDLDATLATMAAHEEAIQRLAEIEPEATDLLVLGRLTVATLECWHRLTRQRAFALERYGAVQWVRAGRRWTRREDAFGPGGVRVRRGLTLATDGRVWRTPPRFPDTAFAWLRTPPTPPSVLATHGAVGELRETLWALRDALTALLQAEASPPTLTPAMRAALTELLPLLHHV